MNGHPKAVTRDVTLRHLLVAQLIAVAVGAVLVLAGLVAATARAFAGDARDAAVGLGAAGAVLVACSCVYAVLSFLRWIVSNDRGVEASRSPTVEP